ETVIEGAPAHEGERSYLDLASIAKLLNALEIEHVVQGIVERRQVRVDLLGQITWQKSELFSSFHRGASQNDALDLLGQEQARTHSHGQVGLSGAGGPDSKGEIELLYRLDVCALRRCFGNDGPA